MKKTSSRNVNLFSLFFGIPSLFCISYFLPSFCLEPWIDLLSPFCLFAWSLHVTADGHTGYLSNKKCDLWSFFALDKMCLWLSGQMTTKRRQHQISQDAFRGHQRCVWAHTVCSAEWMTVRTIVPKCSWCLVDFISIALTQLICLCRPRTHIVSTVHFSGCVSEL